LPLRGDHSFGAVLGVEHNPEKKKVERETGGETSASYLHHIDGTHAGFSQHDPKSFPLGPVTKKMVGTADSSGISALMMSLTMYPTEEA
jgi:hypothetical protein